MANEKKINFDMNIGHAKIEVDWAEGEAPRGRYRPKPDDSEIAIILAFRIEAGTGGPQPNPRLLNIAAWDGTGEPTGSWVDQDVPSRDHVIHFDRI